MLPSSPAVSICPSTANDGHFMDKGQSLPLYVRGIAYLRISARAEESVLSMLSSLADSSVVAL